MGTVKKISSFSFDELRNLYNDFYDACDTKSLKTLLTKHKKDIEANYNISKDMPVLLLEIYFHELDKLSHGDMQFFNRRRPKLLNWCYKDSIYEYKGSNSNDEVKLLILDYEDSERKKFERLKNKFSSESSQNDSRSRQPLLESVRISVWRRDGGKCVKCDSRENLEYDHIIPFSKGGGNTARNIELLCEKCNREKSAKII